MLCGNRLHPLLCGTSPCKEDDSIPTLLHYCINNFLREFLPPLIVVRTGLVCTNSKASVQQQDATVCPWREKTAILRRFFERRIVILQAFVDVDETWWSLGGRTDGEAEAVGLIDVVIRVLS